MLECRKLVIGLLISLDSLEILGRHRLMVRTHDSQSCNQGSTPCGAI
jgi:hypothetical protein